MNKIDKTLNSWLLIQILTSFRLLLLLLINFPENERTSS